MLSMIRSGPKTLLISTPEPQLMGQYLNGKYSGVQGTFEQVFDAAKEENSIVIMIQGDLDRAIPITAAQDAYCLPVEMDKLLCALISDGMNRHVTQIRMSTRMILLRSMGDLGKSLEAIESDYPGETGSVMDLMNLYTDQGTVVAFTEKPLNKVCRLGDVHPKARHISMPYGTLFKELRAHALKYLNAGIGNKDWVELEIRIFDRLSKYELHYKRLLQMIDSLELGLILGESWSKDNPRFMMTVDVYRVRLMTFMEPAEIKRYLVGLEYLEDGMRIADQDVYLNRRKIYWNEVAKGHANSRAALGMLYRSRILERMTKEEKEDFVAVETVIRDLQRES